MVKFDIDNIEHLKQFNKIEKLVLDTQELCSSLQTINFKVPIKVVYDGISKIEIKKVAHNTKEYSIEELLADIKSITTSYRRLFLHAAEMAKFSFFMDLYLNASKETKETSILFLLSEKYNGDPSRKRYCKDAAKTFKEALDDLTGEQ